MTRTRLITLVVLVLGVVAVIAPAASGSKKPKPVIKKVGVLDDYYSPVKLTIKKGNEVNWVWSHANFDSHNVTLIKGPRGVRVTKFTSATGTSGIKFERTFLTPGTYRFQCTIHPESMNMTIVVKK